ncbi:hypothetical protein EDB85DRAFT_410737 [Lactarius pseudohatsudake]|nr:hypothetical protein EDB85DRAFT_410737 [Lactarius pseudohatsudake]
MPFSPPHQLQSSLFSLALSGRDGSASGKSKQHNPSLYSSPALGDPVQSQMEATLASIDLNSSGLKPAFLDSLQVQQAPPIPLFPHQYQSKLLIGCLCTTSSSLSPDTLNAVGEQTAVIISQQRVKPEVAEHDKSSPLDLSAEHQHSQPCRRLVCLSLPAPDSCCPDTPTWVIGDS